MRRWLLFILLLLAASAIAYAPAPKLVLPKLCGPDFDCVYGWQNGTGGFEADAAVNVLTLGGKAVVAGAIKTGAKELIDAAAKTVAHSHHPLPRFLGGDADQLLSKLDPKVHTEFHQLLRQNLEDAGIPLDAANTSSRVWQQYMLANPSAQRTAFDSVLNTSRAIDAKYGTQITQDVWKNLMQGNFTPYP